MQGSGRQRLEGEHITSIAANILIVSTHWFFAFLAYPLPIGEFFIGISIFSTLVHIFNIRHFASVAEYDSSGEWHISKEFWTVENKNNLWDDIKYYIITAHVIIDCFLIAFGLFGIIDIDDLKYNSERPEFMARFIVYFWSLFCGILPFFYYTVYTIFMKKIVFKRFYTF
jgi:hypothetical protein